MGTGCPVRLPSSRSRFRHSLARFRRPYATRIDSPFYPAESLGAPGAEALQIPWSARGAEAPLFHGCAGRSEERWSWDGGGETRVPHFVRDDIAISGFRGG